MDGNSRISITSDISDISESFRSEEGPLGKRLKLSTNFIIKSILPEKYSTDIELEKAWICSVENRQLISSIIQELSMKLPITQLNYLKRVQNNRILICSEKDLLEEGYLSSSPHNVEQLLKKKGIKEELIDEIIRTLNANEIPSNGPLLRWQYEKLKRIWPNKFHPNKYLEKRFNGTNFNKLQLEFHLEIANLLQYISKEASLDTNEIKRPNSLAICVDPRTNRIVAITNDYKNRSTLMHSSMVLVDLVARTQNGGAWNSFYEHLNEEFMNIEVNDEAEKRKDFSKLTLRGIPKRFYEIIQKYREIKQGKSMIRLGAEFLAADHLLTERKPPSNLLHEDCDHQQNLDNLVKYGPYICTGYDVYLEFEPCLMCAMALVHSRVRRIFFIHNTKSGALSGKTGNRVQEVKALNHHYEVYQFVEENS